MNPAVIEVGPATIRSPNPLDPDLVSVALGAIDDDLALLAEHAVCVPDLWTDLMRTALGDADAVVLVCPTWWPSTRTDRVRRAVVAATSVEVVGRTSVLQREGCATVVEFGPELVVVTRAGARPVVIADVDAETADTVAAAVGLTGPVLVDAPYPDRLAEEVVKRLAASGIQVRSADAGAVVRAAARQPPSSDDVVPGPGGNRPRRRAVLTGVGAGTGCAACALRGGAAEPPSAAATLLVEGRVQVAVPAGWPVQRITSGPGSARAQLNSPSDGDVALHLTQSVGPPRAGLVETAVSLRAALADEPSDVFVDFNASGSPAGRAGVTYRELRADHHVAWTVLVEDGIRIAIGCQSAPGRDSMVREVCDQAIRSAHVIS